MILPPAPAAAPVNVELVIAIVFALTFPPLPPFADDDEEDEEDGEDEEDLE